MHPEFVSFKGTREGIVITLGDGEWQQVLNELTTQLDRPSAQSFFRGARVLLETGNRAIDVVKIEELIALLAQHSMTLTSVSGGLHAHEALLQAQAHYAPPEFAPPLIPEMAATETTAPPLPLAVEAPLPLDGAEALLIHRTVRSGQRFHYAGTIVVIGDVNPGAEVIAEGDIIVWGKLRGVVHAGSTGNENTMVGALILTPTQLRIGDLIARAPDNKHPRNWPEVARIRDGRIIVEPWSGS